MARLQVKVIAAMQRLLAVSGNIGSKMVLIRRLVIGESRIAIKPVSAVFYRQMNNRGVEGDDAANGLLYTLFKIGTNSIILLLVVLKPRAVVILRQLAKVLQYPFCIHIISEKHKGQGAVLCPLPLVEKNTYLYGR